MKENGAIRDKLLSEKQKVLRIVWGAYVLLSILLIFFLLNKLLCAGGDNLAPKIVLEDEWNVAVNDETFSSVKLDEFRYYGLNKGDVLTLTTVLPQQWEYKSPALCVPVMQTVVEVYVDDEMIYKYGHDRYEQNKNVGNGIRFVHLENSYKGKELSIVLTVAEERAFAALKPFWVSDWQDCYRIIMTENRVPLLLGVFLLVFGVIMSLLLTIAMVYDSRFWYIFFVSIFSLCMGLWTICYNDVMVIFSIPPYTVTLIENMSLLFAPLAIVGHMYVYVRQIGNKKISIIYNILLISQLISTVVTIILHMFDIIHSAESLNYHYVSYMFLAVFFGFLLIESARKNKKYRTVYYIGMSLVSITVLYELISYAINRYLGYSAFLVKGISAFGIIAFISVILLDLYHDILLRQMETKEKELLLKRAYTDELTQVHNRSYCSEYMEHLQTEHIKEYTVVSLDINNLKDTNDKYGHYAGDLLIKSAADKLSEAFSGKGIIGRMGGDEFIAIIPCADKKLIESMISHFKEMVDDENKANPDAQLSVAYGYALSTEFENAEVALVYKKADDRMYETKRRMKQTEFSS